MDYKNAPMKRKRPSPMLEYGKEKTIELIGVIFESYPEIEKINDVVYDKMYLSVGKFLAEMAEEVSLETARSMALRKR